MTLHDWFQAHSSPALDVLCAFPYGTFIFVCLGFAVCSTSGLPADAPLLVVFLRPERRGFYHLPSLSCRSALVLPRSRLRRGHPRARERGPNLARVDAMARRPLLRRHVRTRERRLRRHAESPLRVRVHRGGGGVGRFNRAWRAASIAFFLLMVFSAVYLDHHWVLDAVAGVGYCLVVVTAARAITMLAATRHARAIAMLHEPNASNGAS